jgi:hypothetical protein
MRAVADGMPGSVSEADDAVQHAWLRASTFIRSGRASRRSRSK